jgi:hypothetical protein
MELIRWELRRDEMRRDEMRREEMRRDERIGETRSPILPTAPEQHVPSLQTPHHPTVPGFDMLLPPIRSKFNKSNHLRYGLRYLRSEWMPVRVVRYSGVSVHSSRVGRIKKG